MRRWIPLIASLLCLLMLLSLLPTAVFADDDEIEIVDELTDDTLISEEELDGELVVLPGQETGWQVPEEELRPFYGRTGWLQLELDRPLLELVGHQRGGQVYGEFRGNGRLSPTLRRCQSGHPKPPPNVTQCRQAAREYKALNEAGPRNEL